MGIIPIDIQILTMRGANMRDIHTDTANITLNNNYWEVTFKKNVVVDLLDMLKIYRLISSFDVSKPLLLDIRLIAGIEYEALEFTASEDELTNRVQFIVYTHDSISEKYVHLIENLDLGSHHYHIFDNIEEADELIAQYV